VARYARKQLYVQSGTERAVQVRFRNIAARIAAERWPDQVEERSDDTVLLTAKLTPGPYLYGWVLGFAGDAEVVAPEDVRQGFLAHVEELRRVYATPAPARVGT
jgi:predicted DNA-binding transcriptional regulator YafY